MPIGEFAPLRELCSALQISPTTAEQWITRRQFRPRDEIARGHKRLFDFTEAMRLLALANISESTCSVTRFGPRIPPFIHGFKNQKAFLVFWVGMVEGPTESIKLHFEGEVYCETVPEIDLASFLRNPKRFAATVICLDNIAEQVEEAFGALRVTGKLVQAPVTQYPSLAARVQSYYGNGPLAHSS